LKLFYFIYITFLFLFFLALSMVFDIKVKPRVKPKIPLMCCLAGKKTLSNGERPLM
jgi:hypothetical protein